MFGMFMDATSFNQPLNNWNVSNVRNMFGMFRDAHSFNQPLNNWNVSKVKYMNFMFMGARSFNQPLCVCAALHPATTHMHTYACSSTQVHRRWTF